MGLRTAALAAVLVFSAPDLTVKAYAIQEVFAKVERAVCERDRTTVDCATESHLIISKKVETVVGIAALATYLAKITGFAPSIKSFLSTLEMFLSSGFTFKK